MARCNFLLQIFRFFGNVKVSPAESSEPMPALVSAVIAQIITMPTSEIMASRAQIKARHTPAAVDTATIDRALKPEPLAPKIAGGGNKGVFLDYMGFFLLAPAAY